MNYLIDRFFDEWAGGNTPGLMRAESRAFIPAVDFEESTDHYLITLEAAGMKKEDIHLEIHEGQLTISGERKLENKEKKEGHWYSERKFGKFQRSFSLPAGTDAEKVEANYEDGILQVVIPKSERAKPRQISISTGKKSSHFLVNAKAS